MFCSKCGAQNVDGAKFCRQCGNPLSNGTQKEYGKNEKKNNKTIFIIIGAIVIIAALIAAILFGMRGKKAKEYEKYLASADKYIEELNYEQAKDYYLMAIDVAPKKLEPYVKLAKVYVDLEEIDEAEEILAKAEENNAEGSVEIEVQYQEIKMQLEGLKDEEAKEDKIEDTKWKDIYIEYIDNNRNYDDFFHVYQEEYKLIDINGDQIPELYINFGSTAGGERVCTYINGKFYDQYLWVHGLEYIEGENIFMNTGGHMDSYYNEIYKITEQGFQMIVRGYYGIDPDSEKDIYTITEADYIYKWDDQLVSEAEYYNKINEYFDTDRAIAPHDGAVYNEDISHYEGAGICLYEEIIEQIKAYPGLPEESNVSEEVEQTEETPIWETELAQTEEKSEELKEKYNHAGSQSEMNQYSSELYQLWDDEINQLWAHLKSNLGQSEMDALLKKQREWIKEKEVAMEAVSKEWEGGSGQGMAVYDVGWRMTEERVYELIEYLR